MTQPVERLARRIAVFPIVMPRSVDRCLEAVAALVDGGARGVEIVQRGPDAMATLRTAVEQFPRTSFAAGTILTVPQYDAAVDAGASLTISPGLCVELLDHAAKNAVPLVPGVQTATEIMAAEKAGCRVLKFYPAEPAGGVEVLRDLCSIFPGASFMPSGKITLELIRGYASLKEVASIGGTWMHTEGGRNLERSEIARRMALSLELFERSR